MPAPDLRGPRMRAAITSCYGAPLASTAVAQVTRPVAADLLPGQLLIKVAVASLCPCDAELRAGMLKHTSPLVLPAILGTDFSGTVVGIGSEEQKTIQRHAKAESPKKLSAEAGTPAFEIGAKVIGRARPQYGDGSCAEYIVADPSRVILLPDGMSFVDGAVLPTPACAAYAALVTHAHLQSGESVLIFGAASGDGHVAVQIAAALNAARVAGVCAGRDLQWLQHSLHKFGARDSEISVYDVESKSRAAIVEAVMPDVVLDCESSQANWDAVRSHSPAKTRFIAYGSLGGGMTASGVCGSSAGRGNLLKQKANVPVAGHTGVEEVGRLARFSAQLVARKAGGLAKVSPSFSMITSCSTEEVSLSRDIAPLLANGKVKARVEKKFRLEHIAAAHALIDNGKIRGQLALDVQHDNNVTPAHHKGHP